MTSGKRWFCGVGVGGLKESSREKFGEEETGIRGKNGRVLGSPKEKDRRTERDTEKKRWEGEQTRENMAEKRTGYEDIILFSYGNVRPIFLPNWCSFSFQIVSFSPSFHPKLYVVFPPSRMWESSFPLQTYLPPLVRTVSRRFALIWKLESLLRIKEKKKCNVFNKTLLQLTRTVD